MSEPGSSGDVVDFHHRYRRGYSPSLVEAVCVEFDLTDRDSAVDLGCGTGQLTRPLTRRLRVVLGVDPEPDVVVAVRATTTEDTAPTGSAGGCPRSCPQAHRRRPRNVGGRR
ncbi:methyltransferase domain-containing protein [Actinokineospora spheciospongiae]|uniref:methyltransferase domain-containing protein n=1 Tax=Actinokineospora spheciospongiae TaxID=909613 RepID=UPI000D71A1EF|nr:methyltransferase domain-containing protein [Actinokineospora spheciospongiae]PWW54850.1 methyltransferase family protein [Actinokineospora spheciospongiae]